MNKPNIHTRTYKIEVFWPAFWISLFLALLKLTGVFNITWLAVFSPLLFVFGLALCIVAFVIFMWIVWFTLSIFFKK